MGLVSDPPDDLPPNPYAAPHTDADRAKRTLHAPGKPISILYGAAIAGTFMARAVAATTPPPLAALARQLAVASAFAASVLAMAWLYAAWKGIPQSHRGTVSPRRAALSMLIPFYNAYWAIAVNLALCGTLDGILERARSDRRAPRALAIIASSTWLASFVVSFAVTAAHRSFTGIESVAIPVVTSGLWLAYMVQCDRARDAVARLGDDVATLGAPRLSPIQRQRGPGIPAAIGLMLLIVLGLACWQIMDPGDARTRGKHAQPPAAGAR